MSYILVHEAFLCTERSPFLKERKGSQKRYLSRSSFIAIPVQSDPLAKLD
jgi:hypothetical protein